MSNWWLGHILGLSSLIFSVLDSTFISDAIAGMPNSFRYCMWIFCLVYCLFQGLRINQRYISDKLDNDRKITENKIKEIEYQEMKIKFDSLKNKTK